LASAGREAALRRAADMLPEDGRDSEANEAIKNLSRLLGPDFVHIQTRRILDRPFYRPLGNLMEDYPFCVTHAQVKDLAEVPGDRLAFPIVVCGQYHIACASNLVAKGLDILPFARKHFEGRAKVVVDVNALETVGQATDMTKAGGALVAWAEVAFYLLAFGG